MEPMPGLLIVVGLIAWVFWLIWRSRDPDPDAVKRLVDDPLPPETVAYRRIGHVLALVATSGGFAAVFAALAIDLLPAFEPALIILIPLAVLSGGVFLWSLPQVLRDTRWSPLHRPVLSMSPEGITLADRWSVRWTEVESIRFVSFHARSWPRPYLLLRVTQRERFPRNSWIAEGAAAAALRQPIDDSTLVIEIGSTTLPEWMYQVLAKRYWCAARGRRYVPALPGFPISGDVSVEDEVPEKG